MISVWVYEKTCPTWSEPLTVGGGVSMENISARSLSPSNSYTRAASHARRHLVTKPSKEGLSGTAGGWRAVDIGPSYSGPLNALRNGVPRRGHHPSSEGPLACRSAAPSTGTRRGTTHVLPLRNRTDLGDHGELQSRAKRMRTDVLSTAAEATTRGHAARGPARRGRGARSARRRRRTAQCSSRSATLAM